MRTVHKIALGLLAGQGAALGTPVNLSPSNASVSASYTPTLTASEVAGAATYDVEYGTLLTGIPTVTGLATPEYALPTQTNITRIYWRFRAVDAEGNPGSWSETFYFDVLVYIFDALYETDAAAPLSGDTEVGLAYEIVGSTARASKSGGNLVIATGATNTAEIVTTTRAPGRTLMITPTSTANQPGAGWRTDKAASGGQVMTNGYSPWNTSISSSDGGVAPGSNVTPAKTMPSGAKPSAMTLWERGGILFMQDPSDGHWYLLHRFLYSSAATMYADLVDCASTVGATSPRGSVIDIPRLDAPARIARVLTTEVTAGYVYEIAANSRLYLRARAGSDPASDYLKIKYRRSDADNYHIWWFDGTTFRMQKNAGAGEVDYTSAISLSSAIAASDTCDIQIDTSGNQKTAWLRLNDGQQAVASARNVGNTDSLNATSTGLVIEYSGGWVIEYLEVFDEQNNDYDDILSLNTVQSINGLISAATLRSPGLSISDGHLRLHYNTPDNKFNFVDIDPTDGSYVLATGYTGRFYVGAMIRHSTGKDYILTDDLGKLIEYNPSTGAHSQKAAASTGKRPGFVSCECPDANKTIFYGAQTNATPASYDPVTGTYTEFPTVAAGRTYIYSIIAAPAGRYVYMVVPYTPWLLIVFDRNTNTPTTFYAASGDTNGELYVKDSDGSIHYKRTLSGGGTQWEEFTSDPSTPTDESAPTGVTAVHADSGKGADVHGFNYDDIDSGDYTWGISNAIPSSLSTPTVTVTDKIGGDPVTVSLEGIQTSRVALQKVRAFSATEFVVLTDDYAPTYRYAPGTDTPTMGGWLGKNVYTVLVDGTDVYLGGYFGGWFRWDTTAAWTMYPDHPDPANANPALISSDGAKFLYQADDGGGNVWAFAEYTRGNDGSVIHKYNKSTGTVTTYKPGSNGDPYDLGVSYPSGLVMCGSYLVASIEKSGGGRMLVIDPTDSSVVSTLTVPNSADDPGLPVMVDSTHVAVFQDLYRYLKDISDDGNEWTQTETSVQFGSHSYSYERYAELGADGYIWLCVGSTLYKIDMTDGTKAAVSSPANTAACLVSWLNGVPYMWNSSQGIIPAQTS